VADISIMTISKVIYIYIKDTLLKINMILFIYKNINKKLVYVNIYIYKTIKNLLKTRKGYVVTFNIYIIVVVV